MDSNIILTILGILAAFLGGLLFSKKTSKTDADILDITGKIKAKKNNAAKQQTEADKKLKEYRDALKEYDPDFDGDDDTGGHSA